jgi:proline dehydrogenase
VSIGKDPGPHPVHQDVSGKEEAGQAVQACERVLDSISQERLNSNLSIKLTQLGIKIDLSLAYENRKRIVQRARMKGVPFLPTFWS